MQNIHTFLSVLFLFFVFSASSITGGESDKTLTAWLGSTPTLDGIISPGEYNDAEIFEGVNDWQSDTKIPSQDADDLSLKAWVKHDGTSLYFAFDVTDDILYGIDIDRWVHPNNPDANDLSYTKGWSWWGDGVEIMMNAANRWNADESCSGDGLSWQIVCSTHKSTLNGLEQGGLMAGEPRTATAWGYYENWTRNGNMAAVVRLKDQAEGRGYVIEWRIDPNPCLQIDASNFVDLSKETRIGINFEVQDLDEQEKGDGNWSNFHHIDYWTRVGSSSKTALKSFGTLIIKTDKIPTGVNWGEFQKIDDELVQNYPNPFNPATTIRYKLSQSSRVVITIYNSNGHHVRSLVNAEQDQGIYEIWWDGKNNVGESVASGLYFCNIRAMDNNRTRKLILIN